MNKTFNVVEATIVKYVLCLVVCMFIGTGLFAKVNTLLIGFGYAPSVKQVGIVSAASFSLFDSKLKNAMYLTAFSRNKNYPEGFEFNQEPYDWWIPTGKEIWSASNVNAGVLFDVPRLDYLALAPYLGAGSKTTYTQYISSATNTPFYNKRTRVLYNAGVDLLYQKKYYGVLLGVSFETKYHIAIFAKY